MMTIGSTGSPPFLVLENSCGTSDDLITVKTSGVYKKEIIKTIKRNIESWMRNPNFNNIRDKPLDLAIVARISAERMKSQDVDNIAKVILDALKEKEDDSRFLFHNDSQIARLLVWKIPRKEYPQYNTDSLTISFRVHDGSKQMILTEQGVM